MLSSPAQFHGFRVTALGDRIITFRVDERYADMIKEIISEKIGREYLLVLFSSEQVEKEGIPLRVEDDEATKKRFQKMLHAKLTEAAEFRGVKQEDLKEELRGWLKKNNYIKESTTELTVSGYAWAIQWVKNKITSYD